MGAKFGMLNPARKCPPSHRSAGMTSAQQDTPAEPPKQKQWAGSTRTDCQHMIDRALRRNPTVKFMMERLAQVRYIKINSSKCLGNLCSSNALLSKHVVSWHRHSGHSALQAGCPIDKSFFTVENCDLDVGGGFRPEQGVR